MTVRAVSERIGEIFEQLPEVWVEGELSEIKVRPGSSVIFMRLRDSSADMSISLKCFQNLFQTVEKLEENSRVIIRAKPQWWTKNGTLAFAVSEMKKVGIGELLLRLEALKNALAQEGLFDPERKKPLPFLPTRVGLICGRNSDAEKDVVENARKRWPSVEFEIHEVAVQGAAAVTEVTSALRELEERDDVDVIIITRGGGSFEDLLPFSDESLLRLVAECHTPIVSAIGHEKDAPLLDLVADYRASTPTDAGKRVVPDMYEELETIAILQGRVQRALEQRIEREFIRIENYISRPLMKDPYLLLNPLDEALASIRQRSMRSIEAIVNVDTERLTTLLSGLRALSPQSTLDRGYAVVQKEDASIVRKATDVDSQELITIRLAEGSLRAKTE